MSFINSYFYFCLFIFMASDGRTDGRTDKHITRPLRLRRGIINQSACKLLRHNLSIYFVMLQNNALYEIKALWKHCLTVLL